MPKMNLELKCQCGYEFRSGIDIGNFALPALAKFRENLKGLKCPQCERKLL